MTVIVPQNVNCNKGLIATQAKPVCIILHSIKEITSDERKTLNDPGYTLATFPKVAKYIYAPRNKRRKGTLQPSELLRTPTPASVCVQLVPFKIRLMCATISCMILLRCGALIAVILKLMLTILRSLSSISWYKSSKLLVSALTIIRSVASTLT